MPWFAIIQERKKEKSLFLFITSWMYQWWFQGLARDSFVACKHLYVCIHHACPVSSFQSFHKPFLQFQCVCICVCCVHMGTYLCIWLFAILICVRVCMHLGLSKVRHVKCPLLSLLCGNLQPFWLGSASHDPAVGVCYYQRCTQRAVLKSFQTATNVFPEKSLLKAETCTSTVTTVHVCWSRVLW